MDAGNIHFITAADINSVMPATAAAVYGLYSVKNEKELQLWSSPSLRVGACVVLHAHGFTGPQIQFLLRWKSDAFMAYLRNLGFLAAQNVALSASFDMPTYCKPTRRSNKTTENLYFLFLLPFFSFFFSGHPLL
jgi:hypothetical protein